MRIFIIGAGEVGFHLAERLSLEGQDIVLLEQNAERAQYVGEQLDVMTVVGNGASVSVLERAGVRGADMVLAVTSHDEVNLIGCLAARRMGVHNTIARVSNPDYYGPGTVLSRDQLGITLMVNPERECAWESYQLLQSAAATDIAQFADGRVQLIGLRVRDGAPLAGKTLAQLGRELRGRHYITVAIARGETTLIPRGTDRVEAGDHIFVLAPREEIPSVPALAGYPGFTLRRVMIAGGSREGFYLAQLLEQHRVACTILDSDRHRCLELAEALPNSLVLHADATDLELLEMEGVSEIDGYVAATGHDETNLLSGLLAKSCGARKVITLIQKFDYLALVPKVGLDAAVSPRLSAVNAILRRVRRGTVTAVATLKGIEAETIEFVAKAGSRIVGTRLRDLDFPAGALVGTIVRDGDLIIPRGNDQVRPGDQVIVFALPASIPRVEKFFE